MNHSTYELLIATRVRGTAAIEHWYNHADEEEVCEIVDVVSTHVNISALPELQESLEELYLFLREQGEL